VSTRQPPIYRPKGPTMNRLIFTRRRAMRAAIFNTLAALALMTAALVLLLAYFDVLTRG